MADPNFEFRRLVTGAGWHQARAARELGLTTGTVSRYWSNEAKPSVPVLRLLSQLLGEPFTDEAAEYRPSAMRDGPRWLEEWEADVITDLRRLAPEPRRRVIRALRELLDAASRPISYRKGGDRQDRTDTAIVDHQVQTELQRETDHALAHPPPPGKTKRRAPVDRQSSRAGGE